MVEKKLNILICGITADTSSLFISLYNYLKLNNHNVTLFLPEYSGAVCLLSEKIPFIKLNEIRNNKSLTSDDLSILSKCLLYDFDQLNIYSKIFKRIRTNQIFEESKKLYVAYKNYLTDNKVDLIIIWGGIKYYSSIPAALAKKNNIKKIFLEKGLFPFTLQVDDSGVNASSKLKERFKSAYLTTDNLSLLFFQTLLKQQWQFKQPLNNIDSLLKTKYLIKNSGLMEFLVKIFHKYYETKLLKRFNYKERWKITDPISISESIEESDFIFIPFQVSDDSQLLIHGGWIKDNISLVKSVYESLTELGIKTKVVIKEHPREFINHNYRDKLSKFNVQFSNAGTIDLIQKSKLIVTINSTVGFEAMVFNKPVLIVGNAFYESIPLINKANNQADLTLQLKKMFYGDISYDESEIVKYVNTVYNNLIKCDYVTPLEPDIDRLWGRILKVIHSN